MHIVLVVRTAASASKAASAGNSKSVQVQSRRKLLKTAESQAKRHPQGVCRIRSRLDTTPGRHLIPQAAQLFKCQSANAKPFSWGSKGAILFCEREWPLCPVPLRRAGEKPLPAQRECCIYFLRSTNFWYCSEIFFRIFSISRLPSSCVSRTKFFVPSLKNSMNASVTMRRVSRSRFL